MKPLCPAALATLGAAVAELGKLPPAANTAAWWRARIGFGDRDLDWEIASALAKHVGARPVASKAKPAKVKPPAPIVTVVDPDDDDDEDDDEREIVLGPRDPKPAKTRTKTLGGVTFEAPHVEPVHVHMLPTKPSTKELVAKAAGMPPELARGLTEAEVCKLAPSWSAKGSK